jgi:WhiB family redox-sensing transcriptional regulator
MGPPPRPRPRHRCDAGGHASGAAAEARRAATEANGGIAPVEVHGLASVYNNWSCRCEPCRDAKREENRAVREGSITPTTAATTAFLPLGSERMTYVDAPWMEHGLCREVGMDLFFPEKGESAQPAKAVCRKCPSVTPCLDYALTVDVALHGVWGATDERQRRQMRRSA